MAEYWYCSIKIKNQNMIYSYISDLGKLAVGEYVFIPFGKDNTEKLGEVVACESYTSDNTPFPLEKTKHIIRIATTEEYENNKTTSIIPDDEIQQEIEKVDQYIQNEQWDDVLAWTCQHFESPDETIVQKVISCLKLCTEQNMPIAALNLGTFYYNGVFVKRDYKEAFRLYKIAADAGELRAICNCGYCFYYGRHQEIDYAEAFKYFTLGALLFDDPNCLYKLGDMYTNGYATEKNPKYAYILYNRALSRCDEWNSDDFCSADIQFRVGKCLLYGFGTGKDVEAAQRFLADALSNFYKRRKTDPFVAGLITSTRKMLNEAQDILEKECI